LVYRVGVTPTGAPQTRAQTVNVTASTEFNHHVGTPLPRVAPHRTVLPEQPRTGVPREDSHLFSIPWRGDVVLSMISMMRALKP